MLTFGIPDSIELYVGNKNQLVNLYAENFQDASIQAPFLTDKIINGQHTSFYNKLNTNFIIQYLTEHLFDYDINEIKNYQEALYVYTEQFLHLLGYIDSQRLKEKIVGWYQNENPEVYINTVNYSGYQDIMHIPSMMLNNDFRANSAGFNLLIYKYNQQQFMKQFKHILYEAPSSQFKDLVLILMKRI